MCHIALYMTDGSDHYFVMYLDNQEELADSEHTYSYVSSPSLYIYEVVLATCFYLDSD